MAQYVKIKRSKNLRFRLISLMYLIFIVLAMVQIPSAWLKNTIAVDRYFTKTKIALQDSSLNRFDKEIQIIKSEFKSFIQFEQLDANSQELNSYSKSDIFFFEQAKGKSVFKTLQDLKSKLNEADSNSQGINDFKTLFANDLQHGLLNNQESEWIDYRFKHLPAIMAINMLEELSMRIKLLGESGIGNQKEEPKLSLMTKYAKLKVGDEALFQVKGDTLDEILIYRNNQPSVDYIKFSDGFVFKPRFAGHYLITVKGKSKSESRQLEVIAAGFPTQKQLPFKIAYKGVDYEQAIQLNETGIKLVCNADQSPSYQDGKLYFKPSKEGWCKISMFKEEGLVFCDSVFVKKLPDPLVRIINLPNQKINRVRLIQLKELALQAFHPSFNSENKVYEVVSFKVRSIGKQTSESSYQGGKFPIDNINHHEINYFLFHHIRVRMGNEMIELPEPILIQML